MRATRFLPAPSPVDELTALRYGHFTAPTTGPFAPRPPAAPRAFDPLRDYLKPRTPPGPRATLKAPVPPDPSRYLPRPAPPVAARPAAVPASAPVAAPAPSENTARPRGASLLGAP